jgi:hypothetical protein
MKVKELIEKLKEFDPEEEVYYDYDGCNEKVGYVGYDCYDLGGIKQLVIS